MLAYDDRAARWHASARARLEAAGTSTPFADGQIAATAAVNHLAVVTRDIGHFGAFDVEVTTWHTL